MISVTLLVKNSEETLRKTLESTRSFDEVVVLDTGSIDTSKEIALSFDNVKLYEAPFEGFGKSHNRASDLATHDWILSLDSDEVLTPGLIEEIQGLCLDSGSVYAIRRRNFLGSKEIKGCSGWYPDWVPRLYSRSQTCFNEAKVHEQVIVGRLRLRRLKNPMLHTPYRKVSDFMHKMQSYTDLFAQQHCGEKKASVFKAAFKGWVTFCKSYLLKKGFLQGGEGFLISAYNGHVAFYKYLKLKEENDKAPL